MHDFNEIIYSPAGSPSVGNFGSIGMQCFLHIRPIVVNLSIFFSTWIIARYLPENLRIYRPRKEKEMRIFICMIIKIISLC